MIVSKCPLRISLVGGATDLQEFIDKYGEGRVINFAADIYTYATINEDLFGLSSVDNKYIINYSTREECDTIQEIKNDIVRECFSHFNINPNTSSLTADIFSSGSGLASSSSYLIAFIKACIHKNRTTLANEKICQLALMLERKFNPLTGYQDPYGCGIKGLKKITIKKPSTVSITQLNPATLNEANMFLCHTGVYRSSTKLLKKVDIEKCRRLLSLVDEAEKALQENNLSALIEIINEGWVKKVESCPEIIKHPRVQELNATLSESPNILGHRLCGAGNGGFFLIFTKPSWIPSQNNLENHCVKINISHKGAHVKKL